MANGSKSAMTSKLPPEGKPEGTMVEQTEERPGGPKSRLDVMCEDSLGITQEEHEFDETTPRCIKVTTKVKQPLKYTNRPSIYTINMIDP